MFTHEFEKQAGTQKPKSNKDELVSQDFENLREYAEYNTRPKKKVFLEYRKKNGRTIKRHVDPLAMKKNKQGQDYFTGWDHKRDNYRSFRLDRFKNMDALRSTQN